MIPTLIYIFMRILKKIKQSQKASIPIVIESDIADTTMDVDKLHAETYSLYI